MSFRYVSHIIIKHNEYETEMGTVRTFSNQSRFRFGSVRSKISELKLVFRYLKQEKLIKNV